MYDLWYYDSKMITFLFCFRNCFIFLFVVGLNRQYLEVVPWDMIGQIPTPRQLDHTDINNKNKIDNKITNLILKTKLTKA